MTNYPARVNSENINTDEYDLKSLKNKQTNKTLLV